MIRFICLIAAVVFAAESLGQGTVVFRNIVSGLYDAPLYLEGSSDGLATRYPTATAYLFVAGGEGAPGFVPNSATSFAAVSGFGSAYLRQKDVTIPGNLGGEVELQIVIYSGGAQIYWSSPFVAYPGVPPGGAAQLGGHAGGLNLDSFSSGTWIPEPAAPLIALIGAAALLWRRRF